MNMLKSGSSGVQVQHLQNSLNFLGHASPPLAVDGIFGPKTKAAVIKFQQSSNLAADGIVGPMTTNALVAAVFNRLMAG